MTWGHADFGGDSSAVQGQLQNVQQIQASQAAFAAILDNGSVVAWGHAGWGGDSSAVQGQLDNVQQIQASERAFAAILGDGSVVTWGHADFGGDSSAVQAHFKSVQQIQASRRAFAAILDDGIVVTWVMLRMVATAVPCRINSKFKLFTRSASCRKQLSICISHIPANAQSREMASGSLAYPESAAEAASSAFARVQGLGHLS